MEFEWLESAYLIKEDDKLKFKFYFSDTVTESVKPLEIPFENTDISGVILMYFWNENPGNLKPVHISSNINKALYLLHNSLTLWWKSSYG